MAKEKKLEIRVGKTFQHDVLVASDELTYRNITGVQLTAPVRINVPAHGLPPRWPVAITNVRGTEELNAAANEVREEDYVEATVVDPDTIEINSINATAFTAYKGGGVVQFRTPIPLAGYVARWQVRDKFGTLLIDGTSANGKAVVDAVGGAIKLNLPATESAALTFSSAEHELEVESPLGVVKTLIFGQITTRKETAIN